MFIEGRIVYTTLRSVSPSEYDLEVNLISITGSG